MPESTPTSYAFIPLVALALLIACVGLAVFLTLRGAGRRSPEGGLGAHAADAGTGDAVKPAAAWRKLRPGMFLWPLPFAGILIFLSVWIGRGLIDIEAEWIDLSLISAGIAALGAVTLLRGPVLARISRLRFGAQVAVGACRDIAILVAVALISAFVMDATWNDEGLGSIGIFYYVFSILTVAALLVIAYFLGQRTGILCCLVVLACFGFGTAQHFILEFKGAAILPSDLLALGTATTVGSSYTYMLTEPILHCILLISLALCLLSFIWPVTRRRPLWIIENIGINLALAGAAMLCFGGYFNTTKMEDDLGLTYDRWQPIETYKSAGFIPSFIAVLQDLAIPEPSDYTDSQASELMETMAASYDAGAGATPERAAASGQFQAEKPAIVAVMNESFSDLSMFDAVRAAGYEGPAFYNGVSDALIRGNLMSSIYGGGTANTEFEFLTGDSMAFIGTGKYPYQLYDFSDVDSLPKQLSTLGYDTTAIHPMPASNWNRSGAYRTLGFDTFLDDQEFLGQPGYHSGVTDRVTYDRILQILREDPDPQFILDVTMQNHGGYAPGSVPDEDLPGIYPEGVDAETASKLNVYLACINRSDADLAYFIGELQNIGRPVILVFFGDHQPALTQEINDATNLGEDELTHLQRIYAATYLVWANYDVAGRDQVSWNTETGANALAALTLDLAGAPLTDRQKSTLASRDQVTSVNLNGYLGADGLRYALDAESPFRQTIDSLQRIQYLEFARKLR